jgi:hypothetical protein
VITLCTLHSNAAALCMLYITSILHAYAGVVCTTAVATAAVCANTATHSDNVNAISVAILYYQYRCTLERSRGLLLIY